MKRLTMTDTEMREIGPDFDCPVKEDGSITQEFCDRVCDEFQNNCPFQKMAERLKEYEDAEEQGLLLRLPVPLDSAVYSAECGLVVRDFVNSFRKDKNGLWAMNGYGGHIGLWGKSVFATQEEAGKVLEEKVLEEKVVQMGRLIDIDEYCKKHCIQKCSESQRSACSVANMSTAFDVEAVIKELQETNKNLCDHIICCKEKCCEICTVNNFLREQIEIIRRGGVKND